MAKGGKDSVRLGFGITIGEAPVAGGGTAAQADIAAEACIFAIIGSEVVDVIAGEGDRPALAQSIPAQRADDIDQIEVGQVLAIGDQVGAKITTICAGEAVKSVVVIAHGQFRL